MAAEQGAILRELMERMGHSSPRAALICVHATRERCQLSRRERRRIQSVVHANPLFTIEAHKRR